MPDRTKAPEIKTITDFALLKPEKSKLKNGLPLFVIRADPQPVCNLQLVFRAGKWYETARHTSTITAKMLTEGTRHKTSSELSGFFSQLGAFIEINAGADLLSVDIYTLSTHLGRLLEVVREILTEASFPDHELQNLTERIVQQIRVNEQKNSFVANNLIKAHLFGPGHAYGYAPVSAEIREVTTGSLNQFYQQRIQHQPFDIMLAGDVTDRHLQQLDDILGSLHIKDAAPEASREQVPADARRQQYIEKEDAVQTSIRMGKKMPQRQHPDHVPLEVLNEVLGGYFGSRLMRNLREEKGFTYGVHSNVAHLRNESYFALGTDVIKEKREEALSEIYREIEVLCHEPVLADELTLVKNYMAGNYIKSINTPLSLADHSKTISTTGCLPLTRFQQSR